MENNALCDRIVSLRVRIAPMHMSVAILWTISSRLIWFGMHFMMIIIVNTEPLNMVMLLSSLKWNIMNLDLIFRVVHNSNC